MYFSTAEVLAMEEIIGLKGAFFLANARSRLPFAAPRFVVQLNYCELLGGDPDLAFVAGIRFPCHLGLRGTKIDGSFLSSVKNPDRVEVLDLGETKAETSTLTALKRFYRLEHLFLDNTSVDDEVVDILCELTSLKTLAVSSTRLTKSALFRVTKSINLESVHLDVGAFDRVEMMSIEKQSGKLKINQSKS